MSEYTDRMEAKAQPASFGPPRTVETGERAITRLRAFSSGLAETAGWFERQLELGRFHADRVGELTAELEAMTAARDHCKRQTESASSRLQDVLICLRDRHPDVYASIHGLPLPEAKLTAQEGSGGVVGGGEDERDG